MKNFRAILDTAVDDRTFQRACQRFANGSGSSEAIAMAVLQAIEFDEIYMDAMRHRLGTEFAAAAESAGA